MNGDTSSLPERFLIDERNLVLGDRLGSYENIRKTSMSSIYLRT
mgnify:CR=1 FL=1